MSSLTGRLLASLNNPASSADLNVEAALKEVLAEVGMSAAA